MKITVIGGTGFIGSKLVSEAISRNHKVVSVSRNPSKSGPAANVTEKLLDLFDTEALIEAIGDASVVIHAFAAARTLSDEQRMDQFRVATTSVIAAAKSCKISRILAVGGAGTLEVAPGVRFVDSYIFPSKALGGARATAVVKEMLQAEDAFVWTSLSPPNHIVPGQRTGKFRLGQDRLLVDDSGKSEISVDDFAVAMIDELETPKHTGMRFTVAY